MYRTTERSERWRENIRVSNRGYSYDSYEYGTSTGEQQNLRNLPLTLGLSIR